MHRLFAAFALIALLTPARADCMRACLSTTLTSADDDLAMRDGLRTCRDTCVAGETEALKAAGALERYADCRPAPLSLEEFRALRSGNPSFTVQSNVLVWELTNVLPNKVIRRVEIGTQTMSLSEAAFTTRTLILPGGTGTVVVMDFFDGYPNARYAGKLTRVEACDVR